MAALGRGDAEQIGVVQTAYANGASTKYIANTLAVPTAIAKTGVKYVHAEAVKFDVGVYFESNGHGTVVFSQELLAYLEQVRAPPAPSSQSFPLPLVTV